MGSEMCIRDRYCVEWKTLGAAHVGAPHRRLRWWAVCYMADSKGQLGNGFDDHPGGCMGSESISESGNGGWEENLADTQRLGWSKSPIEQGQDGSRQKSDYTGECSKAHIIRLRESERGLGGMVDGIPDWLDEPGDIPRVTTGQKNRVSRLKGLGNAVVPQCAMIPLIRLKEILT